MLQTERLRSRESDAVWVGPNDSEAATEACLRESQVGVPASHQNESTPRAESGRAYPLNEAPIQGVTVGTNMSVRSASLLEPMDDIRRRSYLARAWFRGRLRSSQLDLDQAAMRHQEGSWRLGVPRPTQKCRQLGRGSERIQALFLP